MKDSEIAILRASQLERIGWIICFFGMLTQVSAYTSFPSYNVVLGFWAVYCTFTKNGRATFGFISFTVLSILLDVIFCSVNRASGQSDHAFTFALIILILCMFAKLASVYTASQLFAAIGGPASMEVGYGLQYDNLSDQQGGGSGYYYPPNPEDFAGTAGQRSTDSIASIEHL